MPDDPTPLGDAMTHRFPDQKIPEPKAGASGGEGGGDSARGAHRVSRDKPAPDIAQRPPLPDHAPRMAADIEDEDADPVIDSGPGITDGVKPPGKQRG